MMKLFRGIGFFEGASFLLLLCIAMPLKYLAGLPEAVRVVGMAHGLLFIAYIMTAHYVASERNWPFKKVLMVYLAAVLPLGTFVFDKKYLRDS